MFISKQRDLRRVALFCFAIAIVVSASVGETEAAIGKSEQGADPKRMLVPLFVGYSDLGSLERSLFAITLVSDRKEKTETAWKKFGQRFGEFLIQDFIVKGQILVLKDSGGNLVRLTLADSKINSEDLPSLSRAEAIHYLEVWNANLAQNYSKYQEDVELDFNVDGSVKLDDGTTIAEARERARKSGKQLIAFRRPNGALHLDISVPMARTSMPVHVTKNLSDSDWERYQAQTAAISIQGRENRRVALEKEKVKGTTNTPAR